MIELLSFQSIYKYFIDKKSEAKLNSSSFVQNIKEHEVTSEINHEHSRSVGNITEIINSILADNTHTNMGQTENFNIEKKNLPNSKTKEKEESTFKGICSNNVIFITEP